MNVPVYARLGLTGPPTHWGNVRLGRQTIDFAAIHFGAYHILEMGEHFDQYVVAWQPPPLLMFQTAHYALRRVGKQKAAVVTGNIGECVAGIVLRRMVHVQLQNLRHVLPTTAFRTPDYLLDCTGGVPGRLNALLTNQPAAPHSHWPVESKSGKTNGIVGQAVVSAIQQLASFWHQRAVVDPAIVGYGAIVTFQYHQAPEIQVRVIEPSNQALIRMQAAAQQLRPFSEQFAIIGSPLRGALFNVP